MEPLRERRQTDIHVQLAGVEALYDLLSDGAAAGRATIGYEFAYDGGGFGKGGMGTILSTARRLRRDGSKIRTATPSLSTRAPTSARTARRRC